ncbi:hypothetical protein GALL_457190 [mine drainage metagenome]|uniref:Uncharacterized protein n=1 Tax=mine drainage metagenome TaxID=410659 RepID=A0A1J5Q5B3_9ZZZZ
MRDHVEREGKERIRAEPAACGVAEYREPESKGNATANRPVIASTRKFANAEEVKRCSNDYESDGKAIKVKSEK